jgi:flagellar motor switch protein FliG
VTTALATRPATGVRKAAIAIVAMGQERAHPILAGLSESHVREIASEIAALGPVSPDEIRDTFKELAKGLGGLNTLPPPGKQYARDLLVAALGVDRGEIAAFELDSVKPFTWLAEADPKTAAQALASEPAGAVALALAHVEPRAAVKLLTRLPADLRAQVAARVAGLDVVHPETVEEVEAGLRARLGDVLSVDVQRLAGPQVLAQMLTYAPVEQERAMLQSVALSAPQLAEAVRAALFTFDDAISLEPRAMQHLLKAVETRDLALALHGADDDVKARVFGNLSERGRVTLQEEVDVLKSAKGHEVSEARRKVVAQARALEEQGVIELTRESDEDGDEFGG